MTFSIYRESRKGTRPGNQDRTGDSYSRVARLMVAADGMGGNLQGELACHSAAQFLSEAFQRESEIKLTNPSEAELERALAEIRDAIRRHAAK